MRVLLGVVTALLLGLALVARTGLAEPPPPMEQRDITKVIAALEADKSRRADLAAVRFAAEVLHHEKVSAPVGSPLTTLGPWGDNTSLLTAENQLNGCAPLAADAQKKASAIVSEFGELTPPLLRAWTIAGEGKTDAAAKLFVSSFESLAIKAECPSEHPMYSYRRVSRLRAMLACIKTIAPSAT